MTNFEKYFDKCMDILAENLAFNTKKQEPTICSDCKCDECLFQGVCLSDGNLPTKAREWLDEEYKEPQIDWSKVAVDTPILVSNYLDIEEFKWARRYFARYENGKIYSFSDGRTSWSANTTACWKYAKLYEEGGDN